MQKKSYPGGFRLTLATARRRAVQEFGTAKGLEPDQGTELEGFFKMAMPYSHRQMSRALLLTVVMTITGA